MIGEPSAKRSRTRAPGRAWTLQAAAATATTAAAANGDQRNWSWAERGSVVLIGTFLPDLVPAEPPRPLQAGRENLAYGALVWTATAFLRTASASSFGPSPSRSRASFS